MGNWLIGLLNPFLLYTSHIHVSIVDVPLNSNQNKFSYTITSMLQVKKQKKFLPSYINLLDIMMKFALANSSKCGSISTFQHKARLKNSKNQHRVKLQNFLFLHGRSWLMLKQFLDACKTIFQSGCKVYCMLFKNQAFGMQS